MGKPESRPSLAGGLLVVVLASAELRSSAVVRRNNPIFGWR